MDAPTGCLSACNPTTLIVGLAVMALLLMPSHVYVPSAGPSEPELVPPPAATPPAAPPAAAPPRRLALSAGVSFPTADLVFTALLMAAAAGVYACEWVQRKLQERRMVKLNACLGASVERLRAWDAQQEQLEGTLRMVNNATAEYNLLLWLLLRQRRCVRDAGPPSNCFFGKHDDTTDLDFLPPCVV